MKAIFLKMPYFDRGGFLLCVPVVRFAVLECWLLCSLVGRFGRDVIQKWCFSMVWLL
ncbi:MAG: hypothetical protein MI808_15050 [Pseudomonadales bacterium]|nr:hypothetical protein [Pseudomonadales bacterium]